MEQTFIFFGTEIVSSVGDNDLGPHWRIRDRNVKPITQPSASDFNLLKIIFNIVLRQSALTLWSMHSVFKGFV